MLPCRGGGTRTPNRRFWRPVLCQVELRPSDGTGPARKAGTRLPSIGPPRARAKREASSLRRSNAVPGPRPRATAAPRSCPASYRDVREIAPRLSYTLADAPRRPRNASAHMQREASPPPGDRARRRSLFGGRAEREAPAPTAGLSPSAAERAEVAIAAYQEMIQEQLDEG